MDFCNQKETITKMNDIEIKQVKLEDVEQLQTISKQTFYETFSSFNTEENMNAYLEKNINVNKAHERIEQSKFFFLFCLT